MREQLKDIVDFRSGYQFRGRFEPDPRGTVPVIQIKDLDDEGRLQVSNLDRLRPEKSIDAYKVTQGDVLFLSRGRRLFATPLNEPLETTIATNFFFILTPKTAAVAHQYLAWYMNQPAFQSELRPYVRGSHMPLISKADLAEMWIEVPSLGTQNTIIVLDDLRRKEQRLVAEVQQKRSEMIQAVCMTAARSKQ